jgi:hypothetical protein
MNQNDDQLIINVTASDNEVVKTVMKAHKKDFGDKITNLNELFLIGLMHADYNTDKSQIDYTEIGNGTGYYDPLTDAVFVDEQGFAIPDNSSVSIYDPKSSRRLYVIVLEKGNNIIVHDRYSHDSTLKDQKTILTVTGKGRCQNLLNMYPCWSTGSIYDLAQCSNMFGFEFDRFGNDVYVPFSRMDNWFKKNRSQLIPNDVVSKFMSRTA